MSPFRTRFTNILFGGARSPAGINRIGHSLSFKRYAGIRVFHSASMAMATKLAEFFGDGKRQNGCGTATRSNLAAALKCLLLTRGLTEKHRKTHNACRLLGNHRFDSLFAAKMLGQSKELPKKPRYWSKETSSL